MKLVLKGKLDREVVDGYELRLMAYDGGLSTRTGTLVVNVMVLLDSNDNKPEFERTQYEVHVDENTPVGTIVARVRATDRDAGPNAQVSLKILLQDYVGVHTVTVSTLMLSSLEMIIINELLVNGLFSLTYILADI